MRILFYGGCHAAIMRDHFKEFVRQPIEADCLVNFQLIASGRAFPYDELQRYERVVFSPIENKGDYNTDKLVEYCSKAGLQTVAFPWLEWHGYCPTATKDDFKGHVEWFYPKLLRRRAEFKTFSDFVEFIVSQYPEDREIDDVIEKSTAFLAASEERNSLDVKISSFIRDEFRRSRLFVTSDHPSITLYLRVMQDIAKAMGLDFDREKGNIKQNGEWQPEARTPIFPRVKERLGLDFDDPQWRFDARFPGTTLSLEKYLRFYFHYEGEIATSKVDTFLLSSADPDATGREVGAGVRFLLNQEDMGETRGLQRVRIITNLGGEASDAASGHDFFIQKKDWDFQKV
ncbi:MAG: WcbI family polysaccharide biosynthesis putative acetyltransferase [Methylocystis sp.]